MWMLPVTSGLQHFMKTPRDPALAMRHSLCGRTYLVGHPDPEDAKVAVCKTCKRLAPWDSLPGADVQSSASTSK